ncbi:MAG: hypothetical protein IPL61_27080 [Myxococcales bacterium]|nr:hypothetical protein [Myxococcales bacterium]
MRTPLALVLALVGCGADGALLPSASATPRPVKKLAQVARYQRLAVPVAFAQDGAQWIGAVDHDLVIYDGEREVRRMAVMVGGTDAALAPLPDGGWIAGARVLAADGAARFDGWGWAHRYGRFGSPKAAAISPDGRVAIVDGADSPSTCLCDQERGTGGGSSGALVRITIGSEQHGERVLAEHAGHREYKVAASSTAVAAIDGAELTVWPAQGDGPATTAALGLTGIKTLAWASDRYLVATRYVDLDRTDVVVLDRDLAWRPAWTWSVAGMVRDLKVRPGGAELAIAWTNYRATDRVLVDDRRVEVFALDGDRRASVDTIGSPASIAWSPRGDALLVATVGNAPREQAVLRFAAR